MSEMGYRYTAVDGRIAGTLDLWRVHERMPYKMHETKKFEFTRDGTKYLCVLDINKYSSTVREYKYESGGMRECRSSKIGNMYFENGALVIDVKKGLRGILS